MRVTTQIVIDIETNRVLDHQWYDYFGPVERACGATSAQKAIGRDQQSFFTKLQGNYSKVFGAAQGIFNSLTAAWQPILAKGASQRGFSPQESAALKTQAIGGTAANYKKMATAVGEQGAASGGGNDYVPSGAAKQLQGQIGASAAGQESSDLNKIEAADWETGRTNFNNASNVLSGATNVFNPATQMAGQATNAGNSAAQTANEIAQADNAWIAPVAGLVGGAASAVLGMPKVGGQKTTGG